MHNLPTPARLLAALPLLVFWVLLALLAVPAALVAVGLGWLGDEACLPWVWLCYHLQGVKDGVEVLCEY